MKDPLEVKWPWEMVWTEYADQFIAQIRDNLPPTHELQGHDLFPGIKWDGRDIFIVDDDTTGHYILMDFEDMKRWKKTKFRVPELTVFKTAAEVAERIERDHVAECAKYNEDGTPK